MAHGQPVPTTLRVVASKQHYLGWKVALSFGFIFALGLLTACAAPLAFLSSSGTAAASTVGTAAVANPSTAASLASTAATGKSPLEHAASAATKKECSFFNVIDSKPICIDVVLPAVTDKSEPLLGPADSTKGPAKQ